MSILHFYSMMVYMCVRMGSCSSSGRLIAFHFSRQEFVLSLVSRHASRL